MNVDMFIHDDLIVIAKENRGIDGEDNYFTLKIATPEGSITIYLSYEQLQFIQNKKPVLLAPAFSSVEHAPQTV